MTIRRQSGFTLLEIIVVIAILGILAATAVPVFRTWQMRARGSEAKIMAKQILDAQIVYYLDHNKFYPPDDTNILICHDDPPDSENVQNVADNLNIVVPTGHFLEYSFQPLNVEGDEEFQLQISSDSQIFKGSYLVIYTVNNKGEIPDPIYY